MTAELGKMLCGQEVGVSAGSVCEVQGDALVNEERRKHGFVVTERSMIAPKGRSNTETMIQPALRDVPSSPREDKLKEVCKITAPSRLSSQTFDVRNRRESIQNTVSFVTVLGREGLAADKTRTIPFPLHPRACCHGRASQSSNALS